MDEEDDSEAEEERCKLIDRLLAKSDVVDFDGAVLVRPLPTEALQTPLLLN